MVGKIVDMATRRRFFRLDIMRKKDVGNVNRYRFPSKKFPRKTIFHHFDVLK